MWQLISAYAHNRDCVLCATELTVGQETATATVTGLLTTVHVTAAAV
jgi:hypothetical protein